MHIQIYSRSLKKTFKPLLNHLSDGYKKIFVCFGQMVGECNTLLFGATSVSNSGESLLFS